MEWLYLYLFYLVGFQFYLFSNFWIQLNKFNMFVNIERDRKAMTAWFKLMGGFFSSLAAFGMLLVYSWEGLNIMQSLPEMDFAIKTQIIITLMLVISALILHYYAHYFMKIVRNFAEMRTNDEEKAENAHETATKVFKIYNIVLFLFAPFYGILQLKLAYG